MITAPAGTSPPELLTTWMIYGEQRKAKGCGGVKRGKKVQQHQKEGEGMVDRKNEGCGVKREGEGCIPLSPHPTVPGFSLIGQWMHFLRPYVPHITCA